MSSKNRKKKQLNESFLKKARDLGRKTVLLNHRGTSIALSSLYKKKAKIVSQKYLNLTKLASKNYFIDQEVEFIFENFTVIELTISEIMNSFKKKDVEKIPLVISKGTKKIRLYNLFEEFLSMTENKVEKEVLIPFIKEYQKESPLSIREINLIPEIMRLILVENFGILIEEILKKINNFNEAKRINAFIVKSIKKSNGDPSNSISFLASKYKFIPLELAIDLLNRLSKEELPVYPIVKWIHLNLKKQGIKTNKILDIEAKNRSKYLSNASNIIGSLHWINQVRWDHISEEINVVDSILAKDPAKIFSLIERESKNSYRSTIVRIAERVSVHETEVARSALNLALKASSKNTLVNMSHVGYYLADPSGIRILEKEMQYSPSKSENFYKSIIDKPLLAYFGIIGILTFCIAYFAFTIINITSLNLFFLAIWILIILMLAFEISIHATNTIFSHFLPVKNLPRIKLEKDVGENCRTFVVIPSMLRSEESTHELIGKLEASFLGNNEKNIYFALLFDFKDSSKETTEKDSDLLSHMNNEISRLNDLYGKGEKIFFGLVRKRIWNEKEGVFMGWERKRGKLREFNELLRGKLDTSYINGENILSVGHIKYVITLDEDNEMPQDTARKLIGTIMHPLNAPVLNNSNQVVRGYGIIQPRIAVHLNDAYRSIFSRFYSSGSGIDSYSTSVSNIYQDLFGNALFLGKGIYDIDTIERTMANKIPDNTVLSHDILEGIYAHTGFAGDIVVFDGFPNFYHEFIIRLERWTRGDWQIMGWISHLLGQNKYGVPKESFSFIDRFKIIDNLRRSLIPVFCVLALFLGFIFALDIIKIAALILIVLASPHIFSFILNSIFLYSFPINQSISKITKDIFSIITHTILKFSFLFQHAFISINAITTTIIRLYFTRKNLLRWNSFYDIGASLTGKLKEYYLVMKSSVFTSLILLIFLTINGLVNIWIQIILVIWCIAPFIAFIISNPINKKERLSKDNQSFIRTVAYRNALYFLENAKEETNWLIPDHVQEYPKTLVETRITTSPTNIGMHIISLVSSFDFGYISPLRYADRTKKIYSSISNLYRYRGHLINWYDIKNLEAISPRYVSSVDSANFLLSLIAAEQSYAEISKRPIIEESTFDGLIDAIKVFIEDIESLKGIFRKESKKEIQNIILSSQDIINSINKSKNNISAYDYFNRLSSFQESLSIILERFQKILIAEPQLSSDQLLFSIKKAIEITEDHITSIQSIVPYVKSRDLSVEIYASQNDIIFEEVKKIENFVFSIESFKNTAELKSLIIREFEFEKNIALENLDKKAKEFLVEWYRKIIISVDSGAEVARNIISSFEESKKSSSNLIEEADFTFLYDEEKGLFRIGYNIDTDSADKTCYNFLASEANSVSFMAILKKSVPQKHWFYLSRKLVRSGKLISLVSWGGSLFEYLASLIFFPVHPKSLLGSTAKDAIKVHIQDASQKNIPWGMGESAHYQFDENKQYQYQIFGSPKIGLKRNLVDFLVIAPYTTALSMQFFLNKSVHNLKKISRLGCKGIYGFYDSIDYLEDNKNMRKKPKLIKIYYAHHQGFTLASITNALKDNRIQKLFESHPMVQSINILLEEKMPEMPVAKPLFVPVSSSFSHNKITYNYDTGIESKRFIPARTTLPHHAYISNSLYSVCLTNEGISKSLYKGIALTRANLEEASEEKGVSFFIQDKKTGNIYELSPTKKQYNHNQKIIFYENKAEFSFSNDIFDSTLSISVDSKLPVEVREFSITNNGKSVLNLSLMAYAEVSLAEPKQVFHHPHYHHLLVQSKIITKDNAIVFHRPHPLDRSKNIYCAHILVQKSFSQNNPVNFSTSREEAFNRFSQKPNFPSSLKKIDEKSSIPLDPASLITSDIEINPGKSLSFAWIQIGAESYKELKSLIKRYKKFANAHEITSSAISKSALFTQKLGISQEQSVIFQKIASQVLTGSMNKFLHRYSQETLIHSLWKIGVSGDYPIALFFINDVEDMYILRQAIQCYIYWKTKGIKIDIIILNNQTKGYLKTLDDEIDFIIRQAKKELSDNEGSSIYQARSHSMSSEDREIIISSARFVMNSQKEKLAEVVNKKYKSIKKEVVPKFVPSIRPQKRKCPSITNPDLLFYNSWGGFDSANGEYVMTISSERMPPHAWTHIISSENFGTIISDSGSSYTWSEDSHDNRISAWTNDNLRYKSSEIIYLRDDDTGETWNPTPLPIKTKESFLVRYGFGYASYENSYSDIQQKLTIFVAHNDTIKISLLSLKNKSGRDRNITLYYYIEPAMGVLRDDSRDRIYFDYDPNKKVMYFGNEFRDQMIGRTAFVSLGKITDKINWTNDKKEFIGQSGSYEFPQALKNISLSNSVRPNLDNCIALSLKVFIPAGKEIKIPFLIGDATSSKEAEQKVSLYKNRIRYDNDLSKAINFWKEKLNKVSVDTGDLSLDILMNGWLLYQTLSSRIYAKTSFYQPSGAFGFRDQLQDVCAFIWSDPSLVRNFILKAAAHQFKEGDALNWWHDHNMFGLRTVLSDHQLWLAYTLFEYVKATGDISIFEEEIPFLSGPALSFADKKEWTGIPEISSEKGSIFEHAMRAIEKNFSFGIHGLPLMGLNDWNDGLNRVGHQGKGESIWIAWFLLRIIEIAIPYLEIRGETERIENFSNVSASIKKAIEKSAWDKKWYRRAFFDNGDVLGSKSLKEFKIDSLAQSWAVLSGQGDKNKIEIAHESMSKMLLKENYFALIDPALKNNYFDPGYIKDYPVGIRENGSQYNHAALWAIQSYSHIGEIEMAEKILKLINPIERSNTKNKALNYLIEPYVVASDIYGGVHAGRGGWSWYTGSSSLMYTTILEHILGIKRNGATLSITPRIPKSMNKVVINIMCNKTPYCITIRNPKRTYSKVSSVLFDDNKSDPLKIPFVDDGVKHQIQVFLK